MSSHCESAERAPAGTPTRRFQLLALFLVPAACAVFLVDLFLLDQIPWAATLDDGNYAAASYSFVRTGRAGVAMNKGLFGLDRDFISFGRVPAAAIGLSQMVLGTTAFASRLPSLLAVVFAAGLVFQLARLSGLPAFLSLTAGVLWFVSVPARLLAHSARPDAFLMLFFLVSSLFLFSALRQSKRWLFFLSGVVAGFSLEVHMVGSCVILTIVGASFFLSRSGDRLKNAVFVGLGVIPPLLLWAYIHMLSQSDLWRLQWEGLWANWAPAPILDGPSAILRSALRRYGDYFWNARYHRYLVEVPFLVIAVVLAFRQRTPRRNLALLFLLFHASLALLASLPHAGYMAAAYPLACILIAATFVGSSRRILRLGGISIFAFYLVQTAYWVVHRDRPLPDRVRADVLEQVGDKPFLIGDNLWFYFPEEDVRSVIAINCMPFYAPQLSRRAAFEKYLVQEGVQYIVVDAVFQRFFDPFQPDFLGESTTLIREQHYGAGRWIKIHRLTLR